MKPGLCLGEGQDPQTEVGWAAQGQGVVVSGRVAVGLQSGMELEGLCPALVGKKEVNSRSF